MTDTEMQDQDFEWFVDNMLEFNKIYGQKFVAVKNKGVLGVYDTFNEAIDATLKTEQLGSFLIQECFDDEEKLIIHCYNRSDPLPKYQ